MMSVYKGVDHLKKLYLIVMLVVMVVFMTACSPDEDTYRRGAVEEQAAMVEFSADALELDKI